MEVLFGIIVWFGLAGVVLLLLLSCLWDLFFKDWKRLRGQGLLLAGFLALFAMVSGGLYMEFHYDGSYESSDSP